MGGDQGLSSLPPPSPWGLPLWVQVRELAEDLALEEVVRYPSADVHKLSRKRGERPESLKKLLWRRVMCSPYLREHSNLSLYWIFMKKRLDRQRFLRGGKKIHRRSWARWWPSRDIKDFGLSGKNYALVFLSLLGYCNLGAYKK